MVIYSTTFEGLLKKQFEWIAGDLEAVTILLVTLVSTVVILIFGEFIPKNLFRINPNGMLNLAAIPFFVLYLLFYPFVRLSVWLAEVIIRMFFGIEYHKMPQPTLSRIDLQHYIKSGRQDPDDSYKVDTRLFERALELPHVKVRACMVPRLEVAAVSIEDDLAEVRKQFIETKHSKLIVCQNSLDEVLGYMHHQDVLKGNLKVWPIISVPEAMPATNLLNEFIRQNKSIAWVKDEYGGTAGIITLEDIMEEIFGEIQDEYDEDEFTETYDEANDEYEFSARLEIDYLNEKYNFDIPAGDYETLSGYIIAMNEDIPDAGEVLFIGNFRFTITEVSNTTVVTVKLKVVEATGG